MGAVVAVVQRDGAPVDKAVLQHILDACPQWAGDGQVLGVYGEAGIGYQNFFVTPEDYLAVQPLADDRELLVLAADVRLDNRAGLLAQLRLPGRESDYADSQIVLHAYRRWEHDCPRYLLGDFAFVVWDRRRQELFAAVDVMGERTLYHTTTRSLAVVASDILHLLAHPAVQPRLNEGKVADFLNCNRSMVEETLYQGIAQLPPAHCMLITRESVRSWQYWKLDIERRIRYRSDGEYAEHWLSLLHEAVDCRLRSRGPVGLSLSGGLDSTSLAALAAPVVAQAGGVLHSFSYVFDTLADCDERQYIAPVVEQVGLDATYLNGDEAWTFNHFAHWPVERDTIWCNPYFWLEHSVLAAAQAHGCRLLLTGEFGDALFAGGHYWAADTLRHMRLREAASILIGQRAALAWRNQVWDAGIKALVPERVKRAVRGPRLSAHGFPGFSVDFAARMSVGRRAQYTVAPDLSSDRWVRIGALFDPTAVEGYSSARRVSAGFHVEQVSPLHDRRLAEFVTALPAYQLGRPGRTRWIMRNALSGLLPKAVCERQDKTSFVPLMLLGLHEREHERLHTLLRAPQVVQRGFVSAAWLERQLQSEIDWAGEGLWLWLVICLELWLQRHW